MESYKQRPRLIATGLLYQLALDRWVVWLTRVVLALQSVIQYHGVTGDSK